MNSLLKDCDVSQLGTEMMTLARALFPLNRSLTGEGNRISLQLLKDHLPNLEIHEVPSGKEVYDWVIPQEWIVREAYILDLSSGNRIVDFHHNNLHVVGYSDSVEAVLSREELDQRLHSLPCLQSAIPYVTNYYSEGWGFCVPHELRTRMSEGPFRVVIDSKFFNGSMTYAEIVVPGEVKDEIFFSTYICHPSMANNEISGPVIWTFLAKILSSRKNRYTYRFYIGPETIGALNYIFTNFEQLSRIKCGWVLTCIGDAGPYSYVASRKGNTIADKIGRAVVRSMGNDHRIYSFLDRGSDERQFCAPGVDLPVGSFTRSKYGTYPEYHTSLDDMKLLSEKSLVDSLRMVTLAVETLEKNCHPQLKFKGEPFLSKHGLRPALSNHETMKSSRKMMDILAYMDGKNDLVDLCEITKSDITEVIRVFSQLKERHLVSEI